MGVKRPAGVSAREYAENIPDKDQRADFAPGRPRGDALRICPD
jgi:hypothetical protein